MQIRSPAFKANVSEALADDRLQKALEFTRPAFPGRRAAAVANLPEFEQLRDIGRDIKNHTLANLDFYLETYAHNVERAGGTVHWCSTADEARAAVRHQLGGSPVRTDARLAHQHPQVGLARRRQHRRTVQRVHRHQHRSIQMRRAVFRRGPHINQAHPPPGGDGGVQFGDRDPLCLTHFLCLLG